MEVVPNDENGYHEIIPKKGRLLMFTSGKENVHKVEKVTAGTRYAMTVAFTHKPDVDPEKEIDKITWKAIHGI